MAKTPEEYQAELEFIQAKNNQALQQQQALAQLKQQSEMEKLFSGGNDNNIIDFGDGFGSSVQPTKIPLLDAFDQYTRQETLQNPWSIAANAINKTALPKSDNFWENLGGNALQGLLGGGLRSFGEQDILGQFQDEIAPSLKNMYPELNLDGMKDLDSGRMQLITALGNSAHQDKLEELGIKAYGKKGGMELPFGVGLEELGKSPEATFAIKTRKLAQQISGKQNPPSQAMEEAGRLMKSEREQLDRQYKSVEEAQTKSGELRSYAEKIRDASSKAGTSGYYGGAAQTLAGILSPFSSDQEGKYKAGQDLQSFGVEAVKEFGPAFKGPMSDKDVQIMLSKTPGVDKASAFNLGYATKLDAIAAIQDAYSDFMYEMRNEGVPAYEANRRFELFKRENPLVIKGDINPVWLTGEPFQVLKNSSTSSIEDRSQETSSKPDLTGATPVKLKDGSTGYRLTDGRIWKP